MLASAHTIRQQPVERGNGLLGRQPAPLISRGLTTDRTHQEPRPPPSRKPIRGSAEDQQQGGGGDHALHPVPGQMAASRRAMPAEAAEHPAKNGQPPTKAQPARNPSRCTVLRITPGRSTRPPAAICTWRNQRQGKPRRAVCGSRSRRPAARRRCRR